MWSSPHLPGGPSHKEEVCHGEQIEMIGHMHHIQHLETKELLTGSWSSTLWCLLLGHHKKKTHCVLPKHILPRALDLLVTMWCVSQLVTIYEANKLVIPLSTWIEMLKFWLLLTMIVVCKQYKQLVNIRVINIPLILWNASSFKCLNQQNCLIGGFCYLKWLGHKAWISIFGNCVSSPVRSNTSNQIRLLSK